MKRWQGYWFAEGGRCAAAVLRVAIAISVGYILSLLARLTTVHIPGPPSLYRPIGIWMMFGHWVPPAPVFTVLWVLAFGATATMLIGLWSRASAAISCFASIALVSASFSSSTTWSHQYNVVFLAQLAFLGARGGDTFSVDALIRRLRGLPPLDVPRGYQWSVRLVQLAVALMFAGAAFHKLLHAHFTLHWALSDNLRHQLLVRYDLAGLPRPPLASWIIDDVWRYRTAAVLNLISQSMPIAACIFIRRPLVRVLAGGFFVIEVVALGFVVDLWNLHWLPLLAAFIDWDRLIGWLRRKPVAATEAPATFTPPRAAHWFVIGFVVYDALTAVIPTLDQTLNTYPFSAFPMFATVRAREPYDEHQPYSVAGDLFEAISDKPLDEHAQRWLDHRNRRLHLLRDPAVVEKRMRAVLADMQQRFPEFGIHGLRHYLTLFEAPAYPAPAHFEPHTIAEMGEIDEVGAFHSLLGTMDDTTVTMHPQRVDATRVHLVIYEDDRPVSRELTAGRNGDVFTTGPLDGDTLYIVALIEGKPWLVAARRRWRWE